MSKKERESNLLAVRSSLNVILQDNNRTRIIGTGSGVMIRFSNRFFFCTVEHNIEQNNNKVAILTGKREGDIAITVQPYELSFLKQTRLKEFTAEELTKVIGNVDTIKPLDVAFAETQELNLLQERNTITTSDGLTLEIDAGYKNVVDLEQVDLIKKNARYSFAGRVKSEINAEGQYSFEETIVTGIKLVDMDDHIIRFDLGRPIGNHRRFEGCSGAPILDKNGNLVALLKGGDKNVESCYIYGFRLDRLKAYIKITYFNPSLDVAMDLPPQKLPA